MAANNDNFYAMLFPDNTSYEILQEIEEMMENGIPSDYILDLKGIIFYFDFVNNYNLIYNEPQCVNRSFAERFASLNIKYIKSNRLVELMFSETTIPNILDFLENYDNKYFWEAFGVSEDKGNNIKNKLSVHNDDVSELNKIRSEIISNGSLNRDIIINELFPVIVNSCNFTEEELEITYKFLLCCNIVIMSKYPHICEVLDLANKDKEYENKTINSFCSKLYLGQIDLDNITPENLFELIRFSDALASPLNVFRKMYLILFDNESLACQTMINAFKMHKYGYDAYKALLRYCRLAKIQPPINIEDIPELYFYNSYKVPQLPSLYKRYFDGLSEEVAKEKTVKCFKKIYASLVKNGFLDNDILNEFLWAFGLIDKYPHGFKRIAFHTTKEKKANGAFLALLKILGYEEDEIKEMRQERKNKPNLINQIFDLTLSRKTKESKDSLDLLKIVEDSGLPVKG